MSDKEFPTDSMPHKCTHINIKLTFCLIFHIIITEQFKRKETVPRSISSLLRRHQSHGLVLVFNNDLVLLSLPGIFRTCNLYFRSVHFAFHILNRRESAVFLKYESPGRAPVHTICSVEGFALCSPIFAGKEPRRERIIFRDEVGIAV